MNQKEHEILFSFLNEVGIITQLAVTRFNRALPAGLRIMQFSVLNHLIRLGDGKSPLALANAFQVTKPAMTHTLTPLAQKKMIEIIPNPRDGRGKLVYLTNSGKENRNLAIMELADNFKFLRDKLDLEAVQEALEVLVQIRQFLDENREN